MGVANSPDIFQQKANYLFHGSEFIRIFIDNLLVPTKGYWKIYVQKSELTLNKLNGKGFKCDIERSFFGQTKMEYLGFLVTCDGIKLINIKIEAITNMKPHTYRK